MGTPTYSDHRLVIANTLINWHKKTPRKILTKKLNIDKLRDPMIKEEYQMNVDKRLKEAQPKNEREEWNTIVKACKEASAEVLGFKEKEKSKRTVQDPEVQRLSEKQKKIREKINTISDKKQQEELKKREIGNREHYSEELQI